MTTLVDQVAWTKEYKLRSKLSNITNELKLPDQISLIFLMCLVPEEGLMFMDLLLTESVCTKRNNLFFKWLIQQKIFKDINNWPETFAEYLTVIEHWESLKILGKDQNVVLPEFQPKNNFISKIISGLRKILHNISRQLAVKEAEELISIIDNQSSEKNVKFSHTKCQNLEVKLFQWSVNNLINLNETTKVDVSSFVAALNSLNLSHHASDIEIIVDRVNTKYIRETALKQSAANRFEYYPIIRADNIGFCVIINEKVFTNPLLATRYGTEKDVERLIEVFTAFGFDVRVHSNLAYHNLIEVLDHYAKNVKEEHSAFILIILSHGSENIIYTSDSEAVDMNSIEMIFQAEICPNLIGKPKIFIVQACQGEKWQKQWAKLPETNSEILMDSSGGRSGSQNLTGPQRGDSIIAWSTVRGFASFRDKYNGSWYIEELCKELWKFGDIFDLVEIFTKVNNNLRSKTYGNQFMVPCLLLSLRAKIKFPILKQNELKAKQIMLERLLFENYFRKFLKSDQVSAKLKYLAEVKDLT